MKKSICKFICTAMGMLALIAMNVSINLSNGVELLSLSLRISAGLTQEST
jgi:hypothetical protein